MASSFHVGGHDWKNNSTNTANCALSLFWQYITFICANTNSLTADPAVHRHQSLALFQRKLEWKSASYFTLYVFPRFLLTHILLEVEEGSGETRCGEKTHGLCVCQMYDKSCPVKKELLEFAFRISAIVCSWVCTWVCMCFSSCVAHTCQCVFSLLICISESTSVVMPLFWHAPNMSVAWSLPVSGLSAVGDWHGLDVSLFSPLTFPLGVGDTASPTIPQYKIDLNYRIQKIWVAIIKTPMYSIMSLHCQPSHFCIFVEVDMVWIPSLTVMVVWSFKKRSLQLLLGSAPDSGTNKSLMGTNIPLRIWY